MADTSGTTDSLSLRAIDVADKDFIFELVNTKGWLEFIGDRHVHSAEDAKAYIQRILANRKIRYWVVETADGVAAGIVTLIERDSLRHPDIGFAFLPQYSGKGYAARATEAVLREIKAGGLHPKILAITKKENLASIRLLQRLGFAYKEDIAVDKEMLQLYECPMERQD